MTGVGPPSRDQVAAAAQVLKGLIRETPVLMVDGQSLGLGVNAPNSLDPSSLTDPTLAMKLEFIQHSGTFKGRGASHFLATQEIPAAGIVAASGGNHGAAVAFASARAGVEATIFVPTISSPAKVERLRSYGAVVHQVGDHFAEAHAASEVFRIESGALAIHPFNDPIVMAGAGTTALEFEAQTQGLDRVLVACGGGGLAGAMAAYWGERVTVVAVETEGTASYAAARSAGAPVEVAISGLTADALGAATIGTLGFAALQDNKAESLVVSDDDVAAAKTLLWDEFRIVAEPSGATALAAITAGHFQAQPGERVGLVLCGANTSII